MFVLALLLSAARPAHAAAPYQGIYTIIDPYLPASISLLQTAAQTPCSSPTAQTVTPFCGASNGILLRLHWCNFELSHITNSAGQPIPSCHYFLQFSNGYGSPGVQIVSPDEVSPCAGRYDTCSGSTTSILGGTLAIIQRINVQRATTGLPPLILSVGMAAGVGTPQSVLNTVGTVDVPVPLPPAASGTAECGRLPLSWKPQFTHAYEAAYDELLAYIASRFPAGANVMVVKVANITGNDLEYQMPGQSAPVIMPTDPGPPGPGGALQCSSVIPGANSWLSAYNSQSLPGMNFSQAAETSFGTVIGHLWATLKNDAFNQAILSIAVANGEEFANVDCGTSGDNVCSVQPQSVGDWSDYYFQKYVQDLFDAGLSGRAAATAYATLRSDGFALAPQQLAVNSTNLSQNSPQSLQQLSCNMNNTNPVHAPIETLNGGPVQVLGVGSLVGWQTATNSGPLCAVAPPNYGTIMQNGINDGGLYIEVETDAAFTDIATCSPYLDTALTSLLQASPSQTCVYPHP